MIKTIISYNVNGIRSALSKGLVSWLKEFDPDVICIQETKANIEQVELAGIKKLGYKVFWFAAEKKGYSGVAVFTKEEPDYSELGMSVDKFDKEGRIIRVDYSDVTLVNVYVPSGTMGGLRQDFKMDFLKYFKIYINRLKSERPNIIVTGDYNICHKAIDINHPERHKKSSGFLPEEREWVDNFIRDGFIDSFREYNKEPNNYSWWSYRAGSRQKNLGWRIDYFMVSNPLLKRLKNAKILKDVIFSDHCPVMIEIEI